MTNFEYMLENTDNYDVSLSLKNNELDISISLNDYEIKKFFNQSIDLKEYLCSEHKEEQIKLTKQEYDLLIFIDRMLDNCAISRGVYDNQIVIHAKNKITMIGSTIDCTNINKCIDVNNTTYMTPKEILDYCEKWCDK